MLHSRQANVCEEKGYPYDRSENTRPHWPNMVNTTIASWTTCTDSRTWSYCWHNLLKRCRSSIVRPSADSIRRTRARSSRLAWTVHGKTGKRRFWIIRQRWWNIFHNTSSTYSSESVGHTINLFIFRKTPIVIHTNAQNHELHAEGILKVKKTDSYVQKASLELFTLIILWSSRKLAQICRGILTSLLHIDPKRMELPKERSEE